MALIRGKFITFYPVTNNTLAIQWEIAGFKRFASVLCAWRLTACDNLTSADGLWALRPKRTSSLPCFNVYFCRTEVESLASRIQRLNAENDDLLQRLGESKRQKESRERQIEEEKSQLVKRVHELELMLRNGEETVKEMNDRLASDRNEHQVNQRVIITVIIIIIIK